LKKVVVEMAAFFVPISLQQKKPHNHVKLYIMQFTIPYGRGGAGGGGGK
jgi:hypothetical protein